MGRITLKDVAHAAGVSVMTVSNVVNGRRARVSAETAAQVQSVIEQLGYVPDAAARSLVAKRTHLIGVLLPSHEASLLVSPHDQAVVGAVEVTLRKHDYHLMLRGVNSPHDAADSVRRWNLDGVMIMGFTDDELAAIHIPEGVPTVIVDAYSHLDKRHYVRSDDYHGGYLAGSHLISRGCKKVVFAGPLTNSSLVVSQRAAGLHASLLDQGEAEFLGKFNVATTYADGIAAAEKIIDTYPQVDGIFATADILAAGISAGLRQIGKHIPTDIALIGYDDADLASFVSPSLTTIRQGTMEKGTAAAQLLLRLIAGEHPADINIPVDLIVRESA